MQHLKEQLADTETPEGRSFIQRLRWLLIFAIVLLVFLSFAVMAMDGGGSASASGVAGNTGDGTVDAFKLVCPFH